MIEKHIYTATITPDKVELQSGKLIVAIGIPGCGKSSVFRELGKLSKKKVFLEPEEKYWPLAVSDRDHSGYFGALMWFRSSRIPFLYKADQLRKKGDIVLVDSYYDKLIAFYIGESGMEWLINPCDIYYDIAKQISYIDKNLLPNADYIISFEVDKEIWLKFLKQRKRKFDDKVGLDKTFNTQYYFIEAAKQFSKETGATLIEFKQDFSSPGNAAKKLRKLLNSEGLEL